MKARGAPVIASFVAPTIAPIVTRNNATVKPSKQKANAEAGQKTRRLRMPVQGRSKKPPSVTGYYWRKEGVGWDLRKAVYVEENGARKRKQPYIAHLSQEAFQEMKRRHKGSALERAIAQWIADHDH